MKKIFCFMPKAFIILAAQVSFADVPMQYAERTLSLAVEYNWMMLPVSAIIYDKSTFVAGADISKLKGATGFLQSSDETKQTVCNIEIKSENFKSGTTTVIDMRIQVPSNEELNSRWIPLSYRSPVTARQFQASYNTSFEVNGTKVEGRLTDTSLGLRVNQAADAKTSEYVFFQTKTKSYQQQDKNLVTVTGSIHIPSSQNQSKPTICEIKQSFEVQQPTKK